jgi:YD repeat-containing protein
MIRRLPGRCFQAAAGFGYPARMPATRKRAPALFQWGIFPLVMAGAVGWTMQRMASGVPAPTALLLPQLAAFAAVAVLEHVYPYHRSWNRPRKDVRVDATHSIVIGIVVTLATPVVLAGGVAVAGWLSSEIGLGLWPSAWPLLAQGALALVIGELPGYWVHRWQHEWEGLWRIHATHHSAPRLYWLNAGRFHPADTLLTFIPSYGLLVALGASTPVLAVFTLATAVHGIFQHANLQLRLGPLNHFFSMAELHRWHHSKTIDEANHNYGQTVIVWDTLFGTRFLPKDREPPEEIGIPDLTAFPMTWWAQILSPFRWKEIRAASAGLAASCLLLFTLPGMARAETFEVEVLRGGQVSRVTRDEHGRISETTLREAPARSEPEPAKQPEEADPPKPAVVVLQLEAPGSNEGVWVVSEPGIRHRGRLHEGHRVWHSSTHRGRVPSAAARLRRSARH